LAPLAGRQGDDAFPAAFGAGAPFIDSWWDDIQHILDP
jgi:hypothetical protein